MRFSYLMNRNGHYHLRVRTPSDLLGIIPQTEIRKSLKTASLKIARISALPYLTSIKQTVTLLRSRFITPEQAYESLYSLLNWKPRVTIQTVTKDSQIESQEFVKLSQIIKDYISDKEKGWTSKTKKEIEGVFRLTVDLIGDVAFASIDRPMVRGFREKLFKLPPNVYKVHPDHSPLEVLALIGEGKFRDDPMSITTVNKHLSFFSSLMIYGIKEGHRKDNPVSGMSIKQKRRQDEERKAYASEDIQRIIKNLPKNDRTPERFWIPMVCMLSGLRLDEACQLYTEDIIKVKDDSTGNDVWCFDVNDAKDKKLKTTSSLRIVPVHPKLIELGFLDHVDMMRKDNAPRLWMNLNRREADGYSNALGKWFQRFNRQYVTEDPMKTFHSFRHSFADTLKQLGVQESLISELMGHVNKSITTGRYGKRYRVDVLLEAVVKIDYH